MPNWSASAGIATREHRELNQILEHRGNHRRHANLHLEGHGRRLRPRQAAQIMLAGGERVYEGPLPAENCKRVRVVAVEIALEKDDWKEFTKQPYVYQNQFDAGPGNYKLTVVFSAGGENFGRFETPLNVDTYDGKKMALGGVLLTRSTPIRESGSRN